MPGTSDPPDGDDLKQLLAEAMTEALQTLLKRSGKSDGQGETLQTLRREMNQVLTEAPVLGDHVKTMAFRARLGAAFDAECARIEACQAMQQPI